MGYVHSILFMIYIAEIILHWTSFDITDCLFCLFQHVDIAALLIKFNTCVNAVDRWGFTPLHEAAQKGRTQLCSLLVRHLHFLCLDSDRHDVAFMQDNDAFIILLF